MAKKLPTVFLLPLGEVKVLEMCSIKIKRIYDGVDPDDGYRVLVDKHWPRGIRKQDFVHDYWAVDIAPSDQLRRWYYEDTVNNWEGFYDRYLQQLNDSVAARELIDKIRGQHTVTLLFGVKDREFNHAVVLKDFIEDKLTER